MRRKMEHKNDEYGEIRCLDGQIKSPQRDPIYFSTRDYMICSRFHWRTLDLVISWNYEKVELGTNGSTHNWREPYQNLGSFNRITHQQDQTNHQFWQTEQKEY